MEYSLGTGSALGAALLMGLGGLSGCPGGTIPDDLAGDGGRPDGGPGLAEVSGTAIDTYVTEAGDVQQPRDLSGIDLAAFILRSDGTFTRIAGSGTAAGSFRIPGVPAGTYYLKFGTSYFVTSA